MERPVFYWDIFPTSLPAGFSVRGFFQRRRGARHAAVDVFPLGLKSKVEALSEAGRIGTVTHIGETRRRGMYIWYKTLDGFTIKRHHLKNIWVTVGQTLEAKTILGIVGNTGNAHTNLPHDHIQVMWQRSFINHAPALRHALKKMGVRLPRVRPRRTYFIYRLPSNNRV